MLFGRCDEEALRPHQPFAKALSGYLRLYPDEEVQYRLGKTAADLARLVPELTDRVPSIDLQPRETESDRFRSFDSLAVFLSELGATERVLLVIDDLQWADAATLLLLRHIARHADPTRRIRT